MLTENGCLCNDLTMTPPALAAFMMTLMGLWFFWIIRRSRRVGERF